MSTLVFGPDNPYRAPTVARDVATFQGAELEFARTPKVSSTPLDFFYEGVQSFQQAYDLTKKHYEKSAIDSMYKIESEKAQNILNGMDQEEVNRRYADGYTKLADSGSINKNLDAFKVLTDNHVKAREVVVGDVAQEQYDELQRELAEKGYSYVETQKIVSRFKQRWKGTRVGDRLDDQLNQINNKAVAAERDAKITKWVKENATATAINLFPKGATAEDREMQWSVFRGDPDNPVMLYDEDGSIDGDALNHISNAIYDNHYSKAVQGLSPEQQGYAEDLLREQATAQAAAWADLKASDDWNYRREAEVTDAASQVEELIKTPPANLAQVIMDNPELSVDGHIDSESDIYQAAYAMHLRTMTNGRDGQMFRMAWGAGQGSMLPGMVNMADSPEELLRLVDMFPSEDFAKADAMGYTFPSDTPEDWARRRQQMLEEAAPVLSQRMTELTAEASKHNDINLLASIASVNPAQAQQAGAMHAKRRAQLIDELITFGDKIGGEGATVAAKKSLHGGSDPLLGPVVDAWMQLDADAVQLHGKLSSGKGSSAGAQKTYDRKWFYGGGVVSEDAAIALQQGTDGFGKTSPVDSAKAGALDMARAMLSGDLGQAGEHVGRLVQFVQENKDDGNVMSGFSYSGVITAFASDEVRDALQSDDPYKREAATGTIMSSLMTAFDDSAALRGPNRNQEHDKNLIELFSSEIGTDRDKWLSQEGKREQAWAIWTNLRANHRKPDGSPDNQAARKTLDRWLGPDKAATVITGWNQANQLGFGASSTAEGGRTFSYTATNEEGQKVQVDVPVIEFFDNPIQQFDQQVLTRQTTRDSMTANFPGFPNGGDLVEGFAERMITAASGEAPSDASNGEKLFHEVLKGMMKDSTWLATDSYYETKFRDAYGTGWWGYGETSEQINGLVRRTYGAMVDNPDAYDAFRRGLRDWEGKHPLTLHATMSDSDRNEALTGWLAGAIDSGMATLHDSFFESGGKLHPREGNSVALSTTQVMNAWSPSTWDGVEGNANWSQVEFLAGKGPPIEEQQGILLSQANLSDWREGLGYNTIQGELEIYNSFWGTDAQQLPADDYSLDIATAAHMLAEWQINGVNPLEATFFNMENGNRVVDVEAVNTYRTFLDTMGKQFGDQNIFNGEGWTQLPHTLQTSLWAMAAAAGDKAARVRGEDLELSQVLAVFEDWNEEGKLAQLLPLLDHPRMMPRGIANGHPTGYDLQFGDIMSIPIALPTFQGGVGHWPTSINSQYTDPRRGVTFEEDMNRGLSMMAPGGGL